MIEGCSAGGCFLGFVQLVDLVSLDEWFLGVVLVGWSVPGYS